MNDENHNIREISIFGDQKELGKTKNKKNCAKSETELENGNLKLNVNSIESKKKIFSASQPTEETQQISRKFWSNDEEISLLSFSLTYLTNNQNVNFHFLKKMIPTKKYDRIYKHYYKYRKNIFKVLDLYLSFFQPSSENFYLDNETFEISQLNEENILKFKNQITDNFKNENFVRFLFENVQEDTQFFNFINKIFSTQILKPKSANLDLEIQANRDKFLSMNKINQIESQNNKNIKKKVKFKILKSSKKEKKEKNQIPFKSFNENILIYLDKNMMDMFKGSNSGRKYFVSSSNIKKIVIDDEFLINYFEELIKNN